ncbi:hypothetical protein CYMTET_28715 [Cymbomonas tetramitiformis]|uniref:Uncharacterized protein n=1 Tax=Cymbomonas tetramitiformis TaxID=36881 RepID=A0AAE0FMA0_9CHLO|nr:hypothetical protein CYMTET_28715 [Cymbomonas tetramitiformis]
MATEHLYHSASSATKSYRSWKLKKSLDGLPSRFQNQPVFDDSCEGSLFPTFPKRNSGSLFKLRSKETPPICPKVNAGKSMRSAPSSPGMPPGERPKTTELRSRNQDGSGECLSRTQRPDFPKLPPDIHVRRYSRTNAADARPLGQVSEKVIFATASSQHAQPPRAPLYSHTEGEAQETTEQNFRAARHRSMQRKEELTWSVAKDRLLTFNRAWLKEYIYKEMGQKAVVDRLNQTKLCPFTTTEVMFMKSQAYAKAQGGETDMTYINGETRKLMQKAADVKVEKEAWSILQEDFDVYGRVCQERRKQLEHMRRFPLEKLPNGVLLTPSTAVPS